MEFQKLLEIIKKYNDSGRDYVFSTQVGGTCSPDGTKNNFYSKEVYNIYSPALKKEARSLILNGDTEDGGLCRLGTDISGVWYHYEKGDGNQPDKLEIKDIEPAELEKRKQKEARDREQARHDREQAERDRKAERQRKGKEKSPETFDDKKKCAGCEKELDPKTKTKISMGQVGSKEGRIHFCPNSFECLKKYNQQRKNQPDNNSPWGKKCAGCNEKIDCEWIGVDNKGGFYCSVECANKCHKPKSEVEKSQEKLQNLKSKLQNSTNSQEKKNLEREINELEAELRNQQNQNHSKNPNLPQKSYGKIIAGVAIVFIIFGLGLLVIAKKKKKQAVALRKN